MKEQKPAFPSSYINNFDPDRVSHTGVSIRQWYAAKAMQAIVSKDLSGTQERVTKYDIVSAAFQIADVMIAHEDKEGNE